jgi:PAS domain S-box-containing protein
MQEATCADEGPPGHKVSILLVDDQPANLLALEATLAGLGQDLVQAHSGDEALWLLARQDFAVVLLDVQMRGLDGFETAKLIRSRQRSRRTPVIFLTAHDSNRPTVEEAYSLGAVDFLVKPLVPVILRAKVAGLVELYQNAQEVRRQAEQIRQMERRDFEQVLAREDARLRQSEARKAAILGTALDAVITIDHDGKVVEFNPAAERTFGYRRADVLGRRMAELIVPPSLREQHYRGLARYLATGEGPVLGRRIEMPAVRADGTEFPAEVAIIRMPGEGPPLFTGYLRDLTERKKAEQRRNARLALTQLLAEAATAHDAAPRILQLVCEGLGWDTGGLWVVDRHAAMLRCLDVWHLPSVRCDEFERVTRVGTFLPGVGLPGRVWQSGKPAWVADVALDDNFPRASAAAREGLHGAFACPVLLGTEVLGVIEFFCREFREPDADLLEMMATLGGQIGQFMERRRAEQAIRESEERFARFMHHLPGLAWIKDLEGRYVFANDAAEKAFRTPRAVLYGRIDAEVFPPETAAQFRDNDRRALAGGTGVQVVETLAHEDGVLHHSLVTKFPIPGPDGRPALVGGMAIDITDRLRAEEALQEADRRKDEFLAMLAHELRNPLAPVRNAVQVMKMPGVNPEAVRRARDMIERQIQHLVRLVDDLLDVSRIMRNRIELRKERLDLGTVFARAVETARPAIDAQGHQLRVSLPTHPVPLEGDLVRLAQVVGNLLLNAAKYTDGAGCIWLAGEREGGEAIIRVRDTGIGIDPGLLPRIFDPFTQGDRSLARSRGGLGIGLTVVKHLVEMHGGRVSASSPGLGKGSEFVVRLPALPQAPVDQGFKPGDEEIRPAASPRRVLVVDDHVDAAESAAMLLGFLGHEVRTAHDGPSALAAVGKFRPEVVLLDIGLPGMSGYEVARALRAQPENRELILVAVTGYGQEEDCRQSQEAGFDRHLVKPVEPKALQELVASLKGEG